MSRPQRWWHKYPDPFRPVWVIADMIGMNPLTIRSWIKRGKITTACDVKTREIIVHAKEATRLAEKNR